jgi:TetR/AcrR family transcriptional regulator, cholesterol catabolism regulator
MRKIAIFCGNLQAIKSFHSFVPFFVKPEEKIRKMALSLFFRYGVRHVTMDDIARELGMSKKTIYQYYREKDDLVNQLCEIELTQRECQFREFQVNARDPVQEIMLISKQLREMMQHINPSFFHDIRKFYPVAFERFQKFREQCIFRNILTNIKKGIAEGLYREELDPEFVTRYRIAQIDMLIFGDYFSFEKISFVRTHELLLELFVYSICTVKGHKQISLYKDQQS